MVAWQPDLWIVNAVGKPDLMASMHGVHQIFISLSPKFLVLEPQVLEPQVLEPQVRELQDHNCRNFSYRGYPSSFSVA